MTRYKHSQRTIHILAVTMGRPTTILATRWTSLGAAVVGALGDNNGKGSAYVFVLNDGSWSLRQKLTANDGASDDRFGDSVTISGDMIVVGAPTDDIDSHTDRGSAYLFSRSGGSWNQSAKVTAYDGTVGDWFGLSVAISGDTFVVGARNKDIAPSH